MGDAGKRHLVTEVDVCETSGRDGSALAPVPMRYLDEASSVPEMMRSAPRETSHMPLVSSNHPAGDVEQVSLPRSNEPWRGVGAVRSVREVRRRAFGAWSGIIDRFELSDACPDLCDGISPVTVTKCPGAQGSFLETLLVVNYQGGVSVFIESGARAGPLGNFELGRRAVGTGAFTLPGNVRS